jgi:hypothetical protein
MQGKPALAHANVLIYFCRAFGDIGNIQGVTTRSQAAKDKVRDGHQQPARQHTLFDVHSINYKACHP